MSRREHRRWNDACCGGVVPNECGVRGTLLRVYVYILANKSRQLYVGVTNNIVRRMYEHVTNTCDFTSRYRITRLVYFEEYQTPIAAIEREKRLKAMLRSKKVAMIEQGNPAWNDLAAGWFELPGKPGETA